MTTLASLIANPELLTADTTVALTNKDFTAANNTLPALGAGNNTFVASGTIGNGATVALNSDGTVSVVAGVPESAGTAVVFESADSSYISATYDANAQKVVIAYRDDGNSSYGTSVVFQNEGTNAPSFIGFAAEAGTDTNPVSINTLSAENTEQTGLTAGTSYYVSDDGTLSTSDTGVLAGRALSTTSILVQQ